MSFTVKELLESYTVSSDARQVANSLEKSGHKIISHYGTVGLKSKDEDQTHEILSKHPDFTSATGKGDYKHKPTGLSFSIDHEDGHTWLSGFHKE